MVDLSTEQTYKPLLNSRRAELFNWLFFIVVLSVLIFVPTTGFARIGGNFLAAFFLFSSLVLSMANWQNRKTAMTLSSSGVRFENGLQTIWMLWEEVNRIEVFTGRVNDKIRVKSADKDFAFDMYNEVVLNGKSRGAVGFEQGELILETILRQAHIDTAQKQHAEGYDYYTK